MLTAVLLALVPQEAPPVVTVDRDGVRITESCRVVVGADPIGDADGDGVVLVTGNGITIDFAGAHLRGAAADAEPDGLTGVGIRIVGRDVTLRGARVSGFRCAIQALDAAGLVIEDCDVSDNFRQRLGSTSEKEDAADWLRPHANDANEWLEDYGAGLWIEESTGVVVRRSRARRVQNGLVLDGVSEARVYDNDFSFLSGWGIALWRSSDNLITRNATDFCVRGYSHGVYNRGQDSAGILLFEQCSENVVAENSATHCGDGFFAFAGREALGEVPPRVPGFTYGRRGNNENLLLGNDFSHAAAHGIELTFSFDNQILNNRCVGNAICGLWGGYSQNSLILGNRFEANGDAGYGQERGGINIEHGGANLIRSNVFRENACGVHLWWDEDEHLAATPWAKANEHACSANLVLDNRFEKDAVGLQLRTCTATIVSGNEMTGVAKEIDADEGSQPLVGRPLPPFEAPTIEVLGETRPVGARAELGDRSAIVLDEWGPVEPR